MPLPLSIRPEVGSGRSSRKRYCWLDKTGSERLQDIFSSFVIKVTKCYEGNKQLENVLYTRSFNVKVSACVGTGRYCLWGESYEDVVHCIVLNSKFTHRGLSNNHLNCWRWHLSRSNPSFSAWSLIYGRGFSLKLHVADFFFYRITEEKKHFQNQRNTYALNFSRE